MKKNRMKRIAAVLLGVLLTMPLWNLPTAAEEEVLLFSADNIIEENGVQFTKNGKILIKYDPEKPDVSYQIPDTVVIINAGAFRYCDNLSSVTIPDSVQEIYSSAFEGCSSLTSVVIGNGVTKIGWKAFKECDTLSSVTIPDSVQVIDDSAFEGCDILSSVSLGNGVTEIGWYAFSGCSSLESITIPESVTSIGEGAFSGCTALNDVYYSATEVEWNSIAFGGENGFLTTVPTVHFSAFTSDEIRVTLHGKKLHFSQPPAVVNGRTLVPLRAIFEELGATVAWNGETRTITAIRHDTSIRLTIGSDKMYVWDEEITLDCLAQLIGDTTMVPVRAISEAFHYNVEWDGENRVVAIS